MIRLSKKTEYAILALQYLSCCKDYKASAREIAQFLNISFEFLSKTMQQLMKQGIILSQKGLNGGYKLALKPDELTVADVIQALDEKTNIVDCADKKFLCQREKDCTIKPNMMNLQKEINNIFNKLTILELSKSLQMN